jgi:REP element-mobilizing transposase RayT
MTRLRRIEDRDRFFFVTTNLAEGIEPFTPLERDLVAGVLSEQHQKGEFFLFGFVVMPMHVHLLFYPHNKDLIQIMRALKSKTGYDISQSRHARGPIWQARYFDAIVRRVRNFWEKLDYIHKNPVAAGLARAPEEWKWSSYRHYFNREEGLIPVDPVGFSSDGDQFLWPAPWR